MVQQRSNATDPRIRIQKPPPLRIVEPTLQIVQLEVIIVHIPAIPERVQLRDVRVACGRQLLSPRVIGVFYYSVAALVKDVNDVALQVILVEVYRSIQRELYGVPAAAVEEVQLVIAIPQVRQAAATPGERKTRNRKVCTPLL